MPQARTFPRPPVPSLAAALAAVALATSAALAGPSVTVDLAKAKGAVTSATLNAAIDDARKAFAADPTTVYTITIPAGTFQMPDTIGLDRIDPSGEGRLVIQGAGKDQTTIVQSPETVGLQGRDTNHVTVQGITFTLPIQTTTQGIVVSIAPKEVVLDIAPGFPSPATLLDQAYKDVTGCVMVQSADGGWGRYLKAMTPDPAGPQMTDTSQKAVPYCIPAPVPGHPDRWTFPLRSGAKNDPTPDWAPGTLVAVKSKFMKNTYFFCGGEDFTFRDIRWTQRSRGVWRCGFNAVHLDGVEVRRGPAIDGQVPALSSPAGGPQIGQPGEPSSGHLVENSTFEATGDDGLAFFDAKGTVRNCTLKDLFGRLFLFRSDVTLDNDTLIRASVVRQNQ